MFYNAIFSETIFCKNHTNNRFFTLDLLILARYRNCTVSVTKLFKLSKIVFLVVFKAFVVSINLENWTENYFLSREKNNTF